MPYRFIRKISNSVAEVSTPSGHTIRLPYTGTVPTRGSVVNPIIGSCCCPKGLTFPAAAIQNTHTTPSPRRSHDSGRSTPVVNFPVLFPGFSLRLEHFPFNPELPKTYTVIFQPSYSDYPASKFPRVGIGVVLANSPSGTTIQGLTPVRFGQVVYHLEESSFGTAYDNWGNITYYDGAGGSIFGVLGEYRYNPFSGKVSDTGLTIQEYVANHKVLYPLVDDLYFGKYYIGDTSIIDNPNSIFGTGGYSASYILNNIQPKTKFFIAQSVEASSWVVNHKNLDYAEMN